MWWGHNAVHGVVLAVLAVATVALIAGFSVRSKRSQSFSIDSSVAQTVDFAANSNTVGVSAMTIVVEHTTTVAADREANDPTATPFSYPQVSAVDPHWNTAVDVCERVYRTLPGASRELCCAPPQRASMRSACSAVFRTATDIPPRCGAAAAAGVCSGVSDNGVATYDIVYSAVDRSGNKALDATMTVRYVDTTAPVVTVPSASTTASCSAGAAPATPDSLVAYDAVDGVLAATTKTTLRYDPAAWHAAAASLGVVNACPAGGTSSPSQRRRLGQNPLLTFVSWSPSRKLNVCEGDCDHDSDCIGALKCFQRSGYTVVPGCASGGRSSADYCFTSTPTKNPTPLPPTGYPTTSFPTQYPTRFPTDYPTTLPPTGYPTQMHGNLVWHEWTPGIKLNVCEGDCDGDSDCIGTLTCFQRSGYTVVPGCGSGGKYSADYCVTPQTSAPTKIPTPAPTKSPTSPMVAAQIVCTKYCVADKSGNEGCASVVSATCAATQIETGSFEAGTAINHHDTAVTFSTPFPNDGVTFFANAVGSRGGHAATARASGVTGSGVASVRLDEAHCMDEWHTDEQLDWMALQPGRHASLEVGEAFVSSTAGVDIAFSAPIPNAVIIVTIQGDVQDCDFKVVRVNSVTSTGFTLYAQQEEKNTANGVAFGPTLTVGWLAMPATGAKGAALKLSSGGVDRVFRAQIVKSTEGKKVRTTVATAADQRNPLIFASLGFEGRKAAGVRVTHGTNSFSFYVEEERCLERNGHVAEDVHIITVDRRKMGTLTKGSTGVCYKKSN